MLLAIALVCFVAQVVAWVLLPSSAENEPALIMVEAEGIDTIAA